MLEFLYYVQEEIMTYIHRETFEIVEKLLQPKDNCLIIDDTIVPSIQVLNRKGYRTNECCSGHPFKGRKNCYIVFDKGVLLPSPPLDFTIKHRYITINDKRILIDCSIKNAIQIKTNELEKMLEEKAELHKEIEFIIERRWKADIDFYAFLRENVQALEQLYKWALDLPDFKGE